MAKKKKKKSGFSFIYWLLFTVVTGGGISGHILPDLPIIGPLVTKLKGLKHSGGGLSADVLDERPLVAAAAAKYGGNGGIQSGAPGAQLMPQALSQQSSQPSAQLASSRRPPDSILVASFNIQVLGKSKMSKANVVEILAHTIRQFDVVAIQEIRAKDDNIMPQLVGAVNADGSQYNFLIGPRLGRSVSTEQYAYVFDTTRIEHDPSAIGTIQDPSDLMHREPFVARFRARTNQPDRAFTFWLVNAHTDPDEVSEEVAALAKVFTMMQTARADEDDVILLGDLNASEKQLGPLGQIPGINWAIRNSMTNTRKNKSYDNIIFHSQTTPEFTGRWGVYDLESTYGISREEALKVSDHLPVWAEFSAWETPSNGRFANRSQGNRR